MIVKRGDIFIASTRPFIGSEQGGTRPVLIIQNDIGNKHSPTTIIASLTSKLNKESRLPTHVHICTDGALYKEGFAMLEQIVTIDKQRLKKYICNIADDEIMKAINNAIRISLGLQ